MCIVTRAEASEDELVRFARAPEGIVVPDLLAKLPGRGVWVSCSRKVLADGIKRKAFTRGFEEESQAPDGLADLVLKLMRQQAVNQLSLARKAGAAVQGFTKVEEALRKGQVGLLLHVQGAAADGSAKLDRLKTKATLVSNSFHSDELDLAFGRENVVHAAVAAGGLAEKLALLIKRMDGFEGQDGQSAKGSEEET